MFTHLLHGAQRATCGMQPAQERDGAVVVIYQQLVISQRLTGWGTAGGRPQRGTMSEIREVLNEFDGYDLFRRAIVEQEADAWAECVTRYRPLLTAWATSSSASAGLEERCDDIADQAFARAWSALTP